jgi:hypothetical protein
MSEYDKQAQKFIEKYDFIMEFKFLSLSSPQWEENKQGQPNKQHNHYWVTIKRRLSYTAQPLEFEYFDSIANTQKPRRQNPTTYDILATVNAESTEYPIFKEFCDEFGYSDDSIKAQQTWQKSLEFATKINRFFTKEELTDLAEIQ